ncbi:MAG: hypothetical protein Q4D85_12175 [Corynebacterium sp.]|uniref:hypothetical protein n=1 Tax=Corynebacterium sp. TaxID=1720 RepID=UPI0026DA6F7B|nr:hypothetical protein [Corynebacterium sp.]MDO5099493.1 hypothetical protein [Corynebacterium sp.]
MFKRFGPALTAGLMAACIITAAPADAQANRLINKDCSAVDTPVSIAVSRDNQALAPEAPVQVNDELTYTIKITNKGEPDNEGTVGPIVIEKFRIDGVDDASTLDKTTWPDPKNPFDIGVGQTATSVLPGYKVTAEEVNKGVVTRTFEIPVSTNNGNANTCSVLVETSHTLPRKDQSSSGPLIGGIVAAVAVVLAVLGGIAAWFAGLFR